MTKVENLACIQLRIDISTQLKIEDLDLDNIPLEFSQLKTLTYKILLIVIFLFSMFEIPLEYTWYIK